MKAYQQIEILGIDLAKNIFHIHGIDKRGKGLLKKKLTRKKLFELLGNFPKCIIAMEACAGAHYMARKFKEYGHEVRMMAPQFVKPFVKSNKDDAADAEAIAEAASRANMRFVSPKEVWQQDPRSIHRVRQRLVRNKTALSNEIRGLLFEYGIVIPQGFKALFEALEDRLSLENQRFSFRMIETLMELKSELYEIQEKIKTYENRLNSDASEHQECQKIRSIKGMGPLTSTAFLAAVGDPNSFKNGRQCSAWLGLVPRHTGTGGKNTILGISKRGDRYLRSLFVHGARAAVRVILIQEKPDDPLSKWVKKLYEKKGFNKTVVALANKNARIAWAIL